MVSAPLFAISLQSIPAYADMNLSLRTYLSSRDSEKNFDILCTQMANPPELPGFYWDASRRRYFAITGAGQSSSGMAEYSRARISNNDRKAKRRTHFQEHNVSARPKRLYQMNYVLDRQISGNSGDFESSVLSEFKQTNSKHTQHTFSAYIWSKHINRYVGACCQTVSEFYEDSLEPNSYLYTGYQSNRNDERIQVELDSGAHIIEIFEPRAGLRIYVDDSGMPRMFYEDSYAAFKPSTHLTSAFCAAYSDTKRFVIGSHERFYSINLKMADDWKATVTESDVLAAHYCTTHLNRLFIGLRNGDVFMTDDRKKHEVPVVTHPSAVAQLQVVDEHVLIVAGCKDTLMSYDIRYAKSELVKYQGYSNYYSCIGYRGLQILSPSVFAALSDDGVIQLYNIDMPQSRASFGEPNEEVFRNMHLVWNGDKLRKVLDGWITDYEMD